MRTPRSGRRPVLEESDSIDSTKLAEMLSVRVMQGCILLEQPCPQCATPLIKLPVEGGSPGGSNLKDAIETLESAHSRSPKQPLNPIVMPKCSSYNRKGHKAKEPLHPIPGVPHCVQCQAHVITKPKDVHYLVHQEQLQKAKELQRRGSLLLASSPSTLSEGSQSDKDKNRGGGSTKVVGSTPTTAASTNVQSPTSAKVNSTTSQQRSWMQDLFGGAETGKSKDIDNKSTSAVSTAKTTASTSAASATDKSLMKEEWMVDLFHAASSGSDEEQQNPKQQGREMTGSQRSSQQAKTTDSGREMTGSQRSSQQAKTTDSVDLHELQKASSSTIGSMEQAVENRMTGELSASIVNARNRGASMDQQSLEKRMAGELSAVINNAGGEDGDGSEEEEDDDDRKKDPLRIPPFKTPRLSNISGASAGDASNLSGTRSVSQTEEKNTKQGTTESFDSEESDSIGSGRVQKLSKGVHRATDDYILLPEQDGAYEEIEIIHISDPAFTLADDSEDNQDEDSDNDDVVEIIEGSDDDDDEELKVMTASIVDAPELQSEDDKSLAGTISELGATFSMGEKSSVARSPVKDKSKSTASTSVTSYALSLDKSDSNSVGLGEEMTALTTSTRESLAASASSRSRNSGGLKVNSAASPSTKDSKSYFSGSSKPSSAPSRSIKNRDPNSLGFESTVGKSKSIVSSSTKQSSSASRGSKKADSVASSKKPQESISVGAKSSSSANSSKKTNASSVASHSVKAEDVSSFRGMGDSSTTSSVSRRARSLSPRLTRKHNGEFAKPFVMSGDTSFAPASGSKLQVQTEELAQNSISRSDKSSLSPRSTRSANEYRSFDGRSPTAKYTSSNDGRSASPSSRKARSYKIEDSSVTRGSPRHKSSLSQNSSRSSNVASASPDGKTLGGSVKSTRSITFDLRNKPSPRSSDVRSTRSVQSANDSSPEKVGVGSPTAVSCSGGMEGSGPHNELRIEDYIPDYSARRGVAARALGASLLQGHVLTEALCEKCTMPLTQKNGVVAECVVCPALLAKARKLKLEQEKHALQEQKERLESKFLEQKEKKASELHKEELRAGVDAQRLTSEQRELEFGSKQEAETASVMSEETKKTIESLIQEVSSLQKAYAGADEDRGSKAALKNLVKELAAQTYFLKEQTEMIEREAKQHDKESSGGRKSRDSVIEDLLLENEALRREKEKIENESSALLEKEEALVEEIVTQAEALLSRQEEKMEGDISIQMDEDNEDVPDQLSKEEASLVEELGSQIEAIRTGRERHDSVQDDSLVEELGSQIEAIKIDWHKNESSVHEKDIPATIHTPTHLATNASPRAQDGGKEVDATMLKGNQLTEKMKTANSNKNGQDQTSSHLSVQPSFHSSVADPIACHTDFPTTMVLETLQELGSILSAESPPTPPVPQQPGAQDSNHLNDSEQPQSNLESSTEENKTSDESKQDVPDESAAQKIRREQAEKWEQLRLDGMLIRTRRLLAGWSEMQDRCSGSKCDHCQLLTNGTEIVCVVCGGSGTGDDGVYEDDERETEELARRLELWERLRRDGLVVRTQRLSVGWVELPDKCKGEECGGFYLLSNGEGTECLVCGGTGNGSDGAYRPSGSDGAYTLSQNRVPKNVSTRTEEVDSRDHQGKEESQDASKKARKKKFLGYRRKIVSIPRDIPSPGFQLNPDAPSVRSKPSSIKKETWSIGELQKDFELKRAVVSKEIGQRMMKGWTLLDMACPYCVMPMMTDPKRVHEICVLCGPVRNQARKQTLTSGAAEKESSFETWSKPPLSHSSQRSQVRNKKRGEYSFEPVRDQGRGTKTAKPRFQRALPLSGRPSPETLSSYETRTKQENIVHARTLQHFSVAPSPETLPNYESASKASSRRDSFRKRASKELSTRTPESNQATPPKLHNEQSSQSVPERPSPETMASFDASLNRSHSKTSSSNRNINVTPSDRTKEATAPDASSGLLQDVQLEEGQSAEMSKEATEKEKTESQRVSRNDKPFDEEATPAHPTEPTIERSRPAPLILTPAPSHATPVPQTVVLVHESQPKTDSKAQQDAPSGISSGISPSHFLLQAQLGKKDPPAVKGYKGDKNLMEPDQSIRGLLGRKDKEESSVPDQSRPKSKSRKEPASPVYKSSRSRFPILSRSYREKIKKDPAEYTPSQRDPSVIKGDLGSSVAKSISIIDAEHESTIVAKEAERDPTADIISTVTTLDSDRDPPSGSTDSVEAESNEIHQSSSGQVAPTQGLRVVVGTEADGRAKTEPVQIGQPSVAATDVEVLTLEIPMNFNIDDEKSLRDIVDAAKLGSPAISEATKMSRNRHIAPSPGMAAAPAPVIMASPMNIPSPRQPVAPEMIALRPRRVNSGLRTTSKDHSSISSMVDSTHHRDPTLKPNPTPLSYGVLPPVPTTVRTRSKKEKKENQTPSTGDLLDATFETEMRDDSSTVGNSTIGDLMERIDEAKSALEHDLNGSDSATDKSRLNGIIRNLMEAAEEIRQIE